MKITMNSSAFNRKASVFPRFLTAASLLSVASLLFANSASAFSLSANAGVNLVGTVSDQSKTPGASVSATFTEPGGLSTATSSADSNLTLETFAKSDGIGLTRPATSSAGTGQVNYTILGNDSGAVLPLTFNYRLIGSLLSNPGNDSFGVSTASFRYSIISPAGNIGGSAGAGFEVFGSRLIPSTVASGLLGSNITLGTNTLGQQTNFDFAIPVAVTSSQGTGLLITTLVSTASATSNTNSVAISDFSNNGLRLESVTVPTDFNGLNVDTLRVLFDTGRTVQVTRSGGSSGNTGGNTGGETGGNTGGNAGGNTDGETGGDSAAVPEPTTIAGIALAAAGLTRMRQRKREQASE